MGKDLVELVVDKNGKLIVPEGKVAVPERLIPVWIKPWMSKEQAKSLIEVQASESSDAYRIGPSLNDAGYNNIGDNLGNGIFPVQFYKLEDDPNYAGRLKKAYGMLASAVNASRECMSEDTSPAIVGLVAGWEGTLKNIKDFFPEIDFGGGKK